MKKEILLLWFGDNEPAYARWNVENFRKMNPGWEVTYINYTSADLQERKMSDTVLQLTAKEYCKKVKSALDDRKDKGFCRLTDYYRRYYINSVQHPIVYCDIDCFPIAPFDEFFKVDEFCPGKFFYYGYTFRSHKKQVHIGKSVDVYSDNIQYHYSGDGWCLSNIHKSNHPLTQIYINTDLTKPFADYNAWIFNSDIDYKKVFNDRKALFESCKLLADNAACCKYFTPIEHYYCRERHKAGYDNRCIEL